MRLTHPKVWALIAALGGVLAFPVANAQDPAPAEPPPEPFPGTKLLEGGDDLSARMVEGIDKMLLRHSEDVAKDRNRHWKRDVSSREAYEKSVAPNREQLSRLVGLVDVRVKDPSLEFTGRSPVAPKVAETERFVAYAVRWPVFPGVHGEGLLLEPKSPAVARVIALPDADQTPEMLCGLADGTPLELQFARRLAESGCQVLVPVLVDRSDTWSGSTTLQRFTNQPHREWIYRQAFELGRHIIGYEVGKVLAAVDCLAALEPSTGTTNPPPRIAIAGYGEGALLAFHAAALDTRIQAALVSGYFEPRNRLWDEPIYRNLFGLLNAFGDAEIASLIAPRQLIVEYSEAPKVQGPPPAREGRTGAAPGSLRTPDRVAVHKELQRARQFFPQEFGFAPEFVFGNEGTPVGPGSDAALAKLLKALGAGDVAAAAPTNALADLRKDFNPADRQHRTVSELVEHTQKLLAASERERQTFFWNRLKPDPTNDWAASVKDYRRMLWEDVLGKLPPPSVIPNPRSRKILDKPKWLGYELTVDVWPDVYAWAYLLVPKDLRVGERRPVVVCQHGLEGLPEDTVAPVSEPGYDFYKAFAARLADRGFVVLAPHNPYRGADRFRALQRKANPVKASLFSVIAAQHDRLLEWLSDQPFVDAKRIGFYGLSYGGKTAMRLPAILDRYAVSICSGDFNDWVRKNVMVDSPYSYLYTPEYEMPEWNLGNTFNYAEMAALIAPRPFMVERGHEDGVAPDEWVAFEYAKVRHLYARLGWPGRTDIEFFDGPHTINGVGTFQFLYKHLDWMRR